MAELNTSLEIKIKEGYDVNQVVVLLTATGARIDNISGNTIFATTNPYLLNHLRSNDAIESVSDKSTVVTTPEAPQVLPSPGGDANPIPSQPDQTAAPQMTPQENTDHLNPPENKAKWWNK